MNRWPLRGEKVEFMCNLYTMSATVDEVRRLFGPFAGNRGKPMSHFVRLGPMPRDQLRQVNRHEQEPADKGQCEQPRIVGEGTRGARRRVAQYEALRAPAERRG